MYCTQQMTKIEIINNQNYKKHLSNCWSLTKSILVEIVSSDFGFLYNHISSSWITRTNADVCSKALEEEI